MKIIEQTERYCIFQREFEGKPITFRKWNHTDEFVEIRVDENFARANGYKSVEDLVASTLGKEKFKEHFGGVPDWIKASPNREFYFTGRERKGLN